MNIKVRIALFDNGFTGASMIKYKGYIGKIEFEDETNIFHGEVVNTRDVITFQGTTVKEFETAFHDSIDDYVAFCNERREVPDKPGSGDFVGGDRA